MFCEHGLLFRTTAGGGMMYPPTACMMCILLELVAKYIKNAWQNCQAFFGGDSRDRTGDLLNAIQALYHLSYIPVWI